MTGFWRPSRFGRGEVNGHFGLVALVICAAQHARHRPGHGGDQLRAKMSVAWGVVEMISFQRPNPSERSEDNKHCGCR
jgi:hypothetical protein